MKSVQQLINDLQELVENNPEAASMQVVAVYHDCDCVPLGEPQMGHMDEERDFWNEPQIAEWNADHATSEDHLPLDTIGI